MAAILKIRRCCEIPWVKQDLSKVSHMYLFTLYVEHGATISLKDTIKVFIKKIR